MAKPKKYISSKLKVKRKFLLGGDPGQELYLNNNTTYQAADAPTAILQNQFDANEQLKAKQNTAIFGNQMARQMDYLQDLNAASNKRTKEEETARQQQVATNKQTVDQQVTQTAGKAAKDLTKSIKSGLLTSAVPIATNYYSPTWASVNPMPAVPASYGTPMTVSPAMQTATSTTGDLFSGASTVGQNAATTTTASSFGQSAAAIGKSLGKSALVAAPQIAGQIAYNQLNKADDRQMKREGRSQYYDDTEYSRKEFNAQLAKSTGKGATIGGTIGSMIPIPGVGTGVGMAIGAGVGAIAGVGKAIHQRRMTKSEDERGVKIGNKRFGKKLLFGEENVYDENLDPTVIEKRNREAQLKAMTETANAMDNAALSSMTQYDTNTGFNLKTTTGQMAKYGGKIEYLKGGVAKSLGRGAKEYVGKKHEQGGIDLPGNIEVEGGETEQNNYIFSATLKLPTGITYAQAHKNLLASGASSEEIKQLALSQETAAGRNPNEIKTMQFAKYGGPLKYDKGGPKEGSPEFFKEKNFFTTTNGEYFKVTDDGLLTYDPKTKNYKYTHITDSDYGTVEFSNYKDSNKVIRKTGRVFNKNFDDNEKTDKITKLEKRFLDTPTSEKVETKVETKIEETPKEDKVSMKDLQVFQDNATGEYVYRDRNGNEISRSKDQNTASLKAENNLAKQYNAIGVNPPANNTATETPKTETTTQNNPPANTTTTNQNPPVTTTQTQTTSNQPVTTTNNQPVNTNTTVSNTTDNKPTINNANTKFAITAQNAGYLDYTERDKAGNDIWAGDRYEKDWKPLVSSTMGDAANADKVIAYLENYSGQDAADVKAKLKGKTREQKIAAINDLATDKKVGPFHNAVLEGINSTQTPPPPPVTPPPGTPPPASPPETPKRDYTMELPPPPKYVPTKSTNNIGLLQTIPAAYAAVNPINVKPIAPSLAMGYVTPGAVGRTNIGRVSYNTERAANQGNLSAMNQALQNMSGPGAVAGMLAAKTKADQQNLAIANAEQNANIGLAAKEADLNAGISKFNVGNAMQAQTTNAGIAQQNAARMQQASQFNTQLKYAKDVENREQMLGALDRGTAAIVQNNLANRQLDATERLAGVYDAYSAYNRYVGATQAQNNAGKKEEEKTNQVAKFGGAKKYISRLGDLKNVKYKV